MADEKHLKVALRGTEWVQKWRDRYPGESMDLSHSRMLKVQLDDAVLDGADVTWVQCTGASMARVSLKGAQGKQSNFSDVNLEGANLEGTYLKGANFTNANLRGANLRGADLTEAYLIKADLTGADLTDAILTRVTTDGAIGFSDPSDPTA
jgi:uncharacterized protein YjbI with pentapeptide repeats